MANLYKPKPCLRPAIPALRGKLRSPLQFAAPPLIPLLNRGGEREARGGEQRRNNCFAEELPL